MQYFLFPVQEPWILQLLLSKAKQKLDHRFPEQQQHLQLTGVRAAAATARRATRWQEHKKKLGNKLWWNTWKRDDQGVRVRDNRSYVLNHNNLNKPVLSAGKFWALCCPDSLASHQCVSTLWGLFRPASSDVVIKKPHADKWLNFHWLSRQQVY